MLARFGPLDGRPLARVTIYLFTPSLVFTALVRADLGATGGLRLVALVLAHLAVLLALVLLVARLLRLPQVDRHGMALSTTFYNAGNYGLPVALFAFGEDGFRLATVVFVVSAMVAHSLGVYLASAGRNAPWQAAGDILRLPMIYAAVLGVLCSRLDWAVPEALWRPLEVMAQGAIPLLLITLGVHLAQAPSAGLSGALGAIIILRLVVSPVLAAALLPWFGLTGVAANVAVLATAMPTAVNAFLLAERFDTAPALVAGAVLATTVASVVTVTLVLVLLR